MEKNPDYQLSTSVNEGILEIVITGEVTKSNVSKIHDEMISIIKAKNISNMLIDIRTLKGRLGIADTYFSIRSYPSDILKVNTAIVDIEENAAYEAFHEITATNAGRSLKCFTDIGAARAWLRTFEK